MPPSDESLAAQAAVLGDGAAFETLMRRHEQRIHHLLRCFTRDPELAADLCQETFLRAWRKLASFDGRGTFAAWLARLAYNVFLQHRRRSRHRDAAGSLDDPKLAAVADRVLVAPATATEAPDLARLLAAVSLDEQRLLVLSYAAGLSATEIGELLERTPGTVKSQIHRAKEKIRSHFQIEVDHVTQRRTGP